MNVRLTSFRDIGVDEIGVHGDDWPGRSLSTLFSIDLSFCSMQERSWKTKHPIVIIIIIISDKTSY